MIPDPNNYQMKGNKEPRQTAVTEPLAKIDITDKEQVRKLLTDELWLIVGRNRGSLAAVSAIKEIWDRMDGKPGQAVTMNANLNVVTVNASISFIPAGRDKLINGAVDNDITVIDQ